MSPITQGLIIAGIGMGLVFIAILALWGLMVVLVRITAERPKKAAPSKTETAEAIPADTPAAIATSDNKKLHLAAAAAVAIALQMKQRSVQSQRQEFNSFAPRQVNRREALISRSTQLIKNK